MVRNCSQTKDQLQTTSEIVVYVENMIAIPKALAFPDKPALYVLQDLILKGRKSRYLRHPEFVEGFDCGYETFLDYDACCRLTFGKVIEEIEVMLSHALHSHGVEFSRTFGYRVVDHAWNVGAAFGWLSALFESGFVFRLPRTPGELRRRPLCELLSSCGFAAQVGASS